MREKLLALVAEWEGAASKVDTSLPGFDGIVNRAYKMTLFDCIDDVNELLREAEIEHQH